MTLAIIIAVLIMLLFQCFFEVAYVNGKSMEPTFQNGDALLLKKWGVPKKDDIIIAYIEELDLMVVKRILAIEGDVVSIDESGVYVNGKKAAESVDMKRTSMEFIVTANQYFLIGDNMMDSLDSRIWGCIGRSAVQKEYETIEGTVYEIKGKRIPGRVCKVGIRLSDGKQTVLLMDKKHQFTIGKKYRFYFNKRKQRVLFGIQKLDAVLNVGSYYGAEEIE